jgi:hypothetical protein
MAEPPRLGISAQPAAVRLQPSVPRPWRAGVRRFRRERAARLVGWYVPSKLVHWVPQIENLAVQTLSFLLRFGLAWGLAVLAWVDLARAAAMPAVAGGVSPAPPPAEP